MTGAARHSVNPVAVMAAKPAPKKQPKLQTNIGADYYTRDVKSNPKERPRHVLQS